jgi:hypothetical protein
VIDGVQQGGKYDPESQTSNTRKRVEERSVRAGYFRQQSVNRQSSNIQWSAKLRSKALLLAFHCYMNLDLKR